MILNYKKHLKKLITGLNVRQQYVCLALESLQDPLSVKLEIDGKNAVLDVTQLHVFLGYKPVVIGLFFQPGGNVDLRSEETVALRFYPTGGPNNFFKVRNNVASLKLKRSKNQPEGLPVILYQTVHGHHTFINSFYRFVNSQRGKLKKTNAFNIDLPGNERDQVRIAYAVPRIISLITVSCNNLVNIFPTDLHGAIGNGFYASSLRIGGKANEQVDRCGRVVISEIESTCYRDAYSLGKNHMREMRMSDLFDNLSSERSAIFDHPLPVGVLRYRELEVVKSCVAGIHRIYFYKIVHEGVIREKGGTLAHVDQYYAQWRLDHGLPTNLLIR